MKINKVILANIKQQIKLPEIFIKIHWIKQHSNTEIKFPDKILTTH